MKLLVENVIRHLIGVKINKLTIIGIGEKIMLPNRSHYGVLCKCDCGMIKNVRFSRLMNNVIKSCGNCKNIKSPTIDTIGTLKVIEFLNDNKKVKVYCSNCDKTFQYGYNYFLSKTNCACHSNKIPRNTEFSLEEKRLKIKFNGMKRRCYNEKCDRYKNYGERGIKICDEWLNDINKFIEWSLANNYKIGLEIDRIDNDGNYSPDNCRYVEKIINNRNKTTSKLNEELVKEIRYGKYKDMKAKEVALILDVNVTTIRDVVNNKRWLNI